MSTRSREKRREGEERTEQRRDAVEEKTKQGRRRERLGRGKLNEPAFVSYVLDEVASLRDETYQEVKNVLYNNSKKLFNI